MAEEENNQVESVSLLSDNPAEPEQDILDYQTYCDAIASLIRDLPLGAPFTLGIFGSWGSGKTTLLKMIRGALTKQKRQSIWVNVWKVGNDEEVWKAFLQAVLIAVKKELPWYKRWMFHIGLLNRQMDWTEISKKLPELLVKIAIVIVPLYFSLLNIVLPDKFYTSSDSIKVISVSGTLFGAILGWLLLLRPYLEAVNERVKVDLQGLVKTSPLKKRVSLLEEFTSFFEIMVLSLIGKKEKLTVFIDDLDRCPPERMVQVLDAIKLFLDLPYCIYLISMDREIVEQAITLKFANYKDPKSEAREYLEKIIALPFDLPPLSGQQMQALVQGLKTNIPEPEECTRVFALGQEPNPRKVKRTINTFLLLWALANRRKELVGLIKPVRLAKLVVIQHSYRDLYTLLNLFPQYLGELEVYFRKSKQPNADKKLKENLPEYLLPFAANTNLDRLLTLHSVDNRFNADRNFVNIKDGEFVSLSEDEIRNYIRLTRSVNSSQKLRSDNFPVFINRAQELEAFKGILTDQTTKRVFSVSGRAGMGKSALFRQYERICLEQNLPVASIDLKSYSATPFHIIDGIANQLGIELNISFSKATKNISEEPTAAFIDALGKIPKCVILFDTYEAVPDSTRYWLEKELIVPIVNGSLPNVRCGIAGREVKFVTKILANQDLTLDLLLPPFTTKNIEDLLKQLNINASYHDLKSINESTGGNPVLTTLLADQLASKKEK